MNEMEERGVKKLESLPQSKFGSPIYDVDYEFIVRSVIEAMREPTEAMIDAGEPWCGAVDSRFESARSCVPDVWQAMIDEALK